MRRPPPLLLACLLLPLAPACDDGPRSLAERLNAQPGFWFEARPSSADAEQMRVIAESGYAAGYVPAREAYGARVHDASAVEPGWNLYSSGHAPEAFLVDGEGREIHRWGLAWEDVPDVPPLEHPTQAAWRRVRLLEDGSLLAIVEGLALVCVDHRSRLRWVWPRGAHHDLDLDREGRVVVLTQRERLHPGLDTGTAVLEDWVTTLTPDGELVEELSLYDCLLASRWAAELRAVASGGGDLLHTNALEVLDGSLADRHPAFAAGNLLVCFRELDAVAVVDARRRRVVWFVRGGWGAPHDPHLLADGGLLIFDNMGNEGYSRVMEIDAVTRSPRWTWQGERAEDFFSVFCGAATRLPRGNTLVTESCNGRAFEVTPDGRVVWSFLSPHRAGEAGELVAALFEVQRLPPDTPLDWLRK